ncbi:hypothetical protein QEH42_gp217 [Microbacterium phage Pumpernickel]|uniref:Uncharacterized protein n=1 Tax=Microbacterium phage Pumpernickel TaxID=2885983 RepID=A0AAE9C3I6_9CAUD|nr:hypothetical protein QEH42_gp217 [Microbacterium phage Pumpernickel]UDL16001.1 hypothetical protein SEA_PUMPERNICKEL_251 [Microbacterium phage Pumpernickel]
MTTDSERDALADLIDGFIEKNVHMARRLYPDVWKRDLADAILAGGFGPAAGAEWVHCSPDLLSGGVNCADTARRACACSPENGGHDHLVGTDSEPSDENVKAALQAYWGSEETAKEYGSESGMRAALRAARSAR